MPDHNTPHYLKDYVDRQRRFDFLEAAYVGGFVYRDARDAYGDPVLIPHEAETVGLQSADLSLNTSIVQSNSLQSPGARKYLRRKRIAAYENHVRPIVEKFVAYLFRDPPKRTPDEVAAAHFDRIDLDQWMRFVTHEAMKLGEYWIGYDAKPLPEGVSVESLTQTQVREIDPVHGGNAYIVACDPRRVVDYSENADGDIVRVVIEERMVTKASFVDEETVVVRYKEWLPDSYKVWREKTETKKVDGKSETTTKVELESEGTHTLGRVPWMRFAPQFPVEDIADLNRALYNICSLLDEELYSSTFTEKWITGAKADEVRAAMQGTANTLVLDNPEAKVGLLGAIPTQAQSLMARADYLRDAIYTVVSMDSTGTKNVAETAEKKKRDLEALYTTLVRLANAIQTMENWLISSMGAVDPEEDPEWKSIYSQKFDVNSLEDLIAEIKEYAGMPYQSPEFVRSLVRSLVRKVEPFGDHDVYDKEIDNAINASAGNVDQVVQLHTAQLLTPEIAVKLLGVPESDRAAFMEQVQRHPSGGLAGLLGALQGEGDENADENPDDEPDDEAGAGDAIDDDEDDE